MKPKCYDSVASDLTKLAVKPGFTVKYDHGPTNVQLSTDQNLQNPSFESKFKLEPGDVSINIAGGKVTKLLLEPDVKEHGAKLSILPLEGGVFKLDLKQKCPCTKLGLEMGYDSAKTQGYFTIKPQVNIKDQVQIKSKLTFKGTGQAYPVLLDRLRADYKNIRLASCFQPDTNEWRAGLFVDLKKANAYAGTRLHFSKEFKYLAVDIYAKAQLKGIKLSTISTLAQNDKPNVFNVNLQGGCDRCPDTEWGAKLTYAGKDFTGKLGAESVIKGLKVEGVLTTKYAGDQKAFTAGLDAQVHFPLHAFGKGTLGVNLKDLAKVGTPGIRFNVDLN